MPNTHLVPDMLKEVQSIAADLLPATIISTSWPTVPVPPSLTLAAFATTGYVRDGTDLVYVRQAAQPVTLTGADGNYWLAVTVDTWTDYAQWTRQYGTHYAWRPNSTQPADVDGLLVIVQLTVAGGAITAVTPITSRATLAAAWRGLLALGTLATQNANAVAITGGTISGITSLSGVAVAGLYGLQVGDRVGNDVIALSSAINAAGGSNRWGIIHYGDAPSLIHGTLQLDSYVGIRRAPTGSGLVSLLYDRSTNGLLMTPNVDTGAPAVLFQNAAAGTVGSIVTSATATSYNTSSDARLKHAVQALTGALAAIQALRPVTFRWNATEESDIGFLAHELMGPVPTAVTGLPDEINPDGSVKPQQVDQSKLVPLLTAGIKELLAQVEALTARVTVLETALGV